MRAVVTRVNHATVHINGELHASIGKGLLIFLGVHRDDTEKEAAKIADKICGLRIFEDEAGKMNLAAGTVGAEILIVSQFTLFASYKKGNRPSWLRAARHEVSVPLYEEFCRKMSDGMGRNVGTGVFGADMQVELLNDGPVTICMDTKNKE